MTLGILILIYVFLIRSRVRVKTKIIEGLQSLPKEVRQGLGAQPEEIDQYVRLQKKGFMNSGVVQLSMIILISLIVLASGLYVILSGAYADSEQKWAYSAIGTVLGFWLKPGV
jgi:hypothetical protein